jgi:hypothetical protein
MRSRLLASIKFVFAGIDGQGQGLGIIVSVPVISLGHHHENPATSATVLQSNVLGIYRLLKYGVQKRLSQWAAFRSLLL